MRSEKYEDLTGRRFGKLVAVQRVQNDKWNSVMWECKCDCGGVIKTRAQSLKSGHTQSCGCINKEHIRNTGYKNAFKLCGMTFGNLTVIKRCGSNRAQQSLWLCKCTCGKEIIVLGNHLANGHKTNCGCLTKIKTPLCFPKKRGKTIYPSVRTYTVYGLYEDVDKLIYVGSTKQYLQMRFREHCCKTRNKKISKYIRSVGKEHFSIKPILSGVSTYEKALEIETWLTKWYRQQGYNLQNLQEGNSTGYKHSIATRLKFRNAKKGKLNTHLSKKVICVETQLVYPSISEAGRTLKVHATAIGQAIRCGGTSCGYHWKYMR